MSYPAETKERVCQLYREGSSRRQISETMGIPRRTIQAWTAEMGGGVISCQVCDNRKYVKRLSAKYCSESCKKRAQYQRKHPPAPSRRCVEVECKKWFNPRNDKRHIYCSRKCLNRAAQRRRRKQSRAEQASE